MTKTKPVLISIFLLVVLVQQRLNDRRDRIDVFDVFDRQGALGQLDNLAGEVEAATLTDSNHDLITHSMPERLQGNVGVKGVVTSSETSTNGGRRRRQDPGAAG